MEQAAIHNSQIPTSEPPRKNVTDTILKFLPLSNWIITVTIGIAVFGLGFRDTQTNQGAELNRIVNDQKAIRDTMNERKNGWDKNLQEFRDTMVTRDVFKAYMDSIKDEQNRQRGMIEKLLER